jgi:tetratricopeptide (TPR) repeat protein
MIYEAKAVLDVAIADQPPTAENPSAVVLRAVCNIMIGRADMGLKDLANPFVGNQNDAPLWRALAYAKLGKWPEAREGFHAVEAAVGTLPLELQRNVMKEMIRAYIEVGDITGATAQLNEFEAIGIPQELEPAMALLNGRLNEGLGRTEDARRFYQVAADSRDRGAAAQGRLREVVLRQARQDIDRVDAISQLETLAATWRGDPTEIEALQMLGRAYTDDRRYRDAFQIMRTAISVNPNSEMTRRIQDEAASTFDSLFLAGKGDTLPAIDALAMFYDFRDLTPIGRRGDEMIRRLADRLVSVDLLQQATDLLKHQVDNRLQGAARAQVAARLAAIYLMDRKPDRALAALRGTRSSELSNELRNQRLMLEARALSETGRHDVALEVVANVSGPEAIRLRADIQWAAKHWALAAEQIELLYGERWRQFEPLEDKERLDILRAAVGYALGDDVLGLNRFREKFAAKMGDGPDRRAFDVLTAPAAASDAEFGDVARALRAADTLEAFLRDLRARYPALGTLPASRQRAASEDRTVQAR